MSAPPTEAEHAAAAAWPLLFAAENPLPAWAALDTVADFAGGARAAYVALLGAAGRAARASLPERQKRAGEELHLIRQRAENAARALRRGSLSRAVVCQLDVVLDFAERLGPPWDAWWREFATVLQKCAELNRLAYKLEPPLGGHAPWFRALGDPM